jgi:hypothetical protein
MGIECITVTVPFMPPDGYNTITVSEDVFALLAEVMDEYTYEGNRRCGRNHIDHDFGFNNAELAQLLIDQLPRVARFMRITVKHAQITVYSVNSSIRCYTEDNTIRA